MPLVKSNFYFQEISEVMAQNDNEAEIEEIRACVRMLAEKKIHDAVVEKILLKCVEILNRDDVDEYDSIFIIIPIKSRSLTHTYTFPK